MDVSSAVNGHQEGYRFNRSAVGSLSGLKSILKNIRELGLFGERTHLHTILGEKIHINAFDQAMDMVRGKINKSNNILHVNSIAITEFEQLLKKGDLRKLVKAIVVDIVVDAESSHAFNKLTTKYPHKTLNDIDVMTDTVEPSKVKIDFKLSNLDKMSPEGKSK